jgi:hypothetical protein
MSLSEAAISNLCNVHNNAFPCEGGGARNDDIAHDLSGSDIPKKDKVDTSSNRDTAESKYKSKYHTSVFDQNRYYNKEKKRLVF